MYTLIVKIDKDAPENVRSFYMNYKSAHSGDAGIDLIVPTNIIFPEFDNNKINHMISCAMLSPSGEYVSYYLYPRSSISKTPLIMANSVGIIDAGYRGSIIGVCRNLSNTAYQVSADNRLFQICAPTLQPIKIRVLGDGEEFEETSRGAGGFGSTSISNLQNTGLRIGELEQHAMVSHGLNMKDLEKIMNENSDSQQLDKAVEQINQNLEQANQLEDKLKQQNDDIKAIEFSLPLCR